MSHSSMVLQSSLVFVWIVLSLISALYLRTYPGSFLGYTNVFTVVAPSSSVDREQVTFTLIASKGVIPSDYDLLKNIVKSALGAQLDIDISRVTDIH